MPPDAHLWSIEFAAANAVITRRIWDHAGVADRVTAVVGSLGDGGTTLDRLSDDHGFAEGNLDFVFIDHDKSAYLPDLESLLKRGWLRRGSVVVANNVKIPGAPKYRAYMRAEQDTLWCTTEHPAHVKYQTLFKDLVLVSEYLGQG